MKNIVHLIDCMEFMKGLSDKAYDLAIVDPPYGIGAGAKHTGCTKRRQKHSPMFVRVKLGDWDKKPATKEYFKELFRVSRNQIICGGNYFNLPPTRGIICWDKGLCLRGRSFSEWEFIWSSFDCTAKLFYHDLTAGLGFVTSKTSSEREDKIHPTQKPIALYRWLLNNYAKPGQTIFDSHVGSGSIRIACDELGFDFEGCELDQDYWQAQEQRYRDFKAQPRLFEPLEIKQKELFKTEAP